MIDEISNVISGQVSEQQKMNFIHKFYSIHLPSKLLSYAKYFGTDISQLVSQVLDDSYAAYAADPS